MVKETRQSYKLTVSNYRLRISKLMFRKLAFTLYHLFFILLYMETAIFAVTIQCSYLLTAELYKQFDANEDIHFTLIYGQIRKTR